MGWGTPARRLALGLGVTYAVFVAVAFVAIDPIMFQAPKPADYDMNPQLLRLPVDDHTIVVQHRTVEAPRATVLFAHGNGRDLGDLFVATDALVAAGFDVVSFDYAGYGHSTGEASEEATYADIAAVYRYVVDELDVEPEDVVAVGHSLGGGPAAWLARHRPTRGLVLASTFTSATNVVLPSWLLPFDSYETVDVLPRIDVPVVILHGSDDSIIDVDNAHDLFDAANEPRRKVIVDGAGHDAIYHEGAPDLVDAVDWVLGRRATDGS